MDHTGSQSGAPPSVLMARHHAWLALAYVALVIYGSLVPFQFQPRPLNDAIASFHEVYSSSVRVESRSDWAANLLLFVPLGYLLMASLCVDRPRPVGLAAALIVIPVCWALSTGIEFAQLFFPPRVSSLNDIVAESLGGAVGTSLWLVGGQRATHWLRQTWIAVGQRNSVLQLLCGYTLFLVLANTLPLDLTLSPAEIYHKYKEGRLQLVPFRAQHLGQWEIVQKHLTTVCFFLPVGLLLAWLPGARWRKWQGVLHVLALGLGLSGLVAFLKLFVMSRTFDTTDVVTGSMAIVGGWAAGRLYTVFVAQHRGAVDGDSVRRVDPGEDPHARIRWALFVVWLGVLVFVNWRPFDVITDPRLVLERFDKTSFIPFADYYAGNYLNAFDQAVSKVAYFIPFGALLTPTGRAATRRCVKYIVLLAACGLATVLETGQLWLVSRYASVTDVLVETFGAWLGFVVTRHVWARNQTASKQ